MKGIVLSLVVAAMLIMMALLGATPPATLVAYPGSLLLDCKASSNTTDVCGSINWTGWVWGGEEPYYWSWRVDGIERASFNNTGNSTSFNWTFNTTGIHEVCFNVTDSQGNTPERLCCTNVTVLGPLLTIEKIDSPDPVSCNGALNYTISVNNTGTGNATDVTIIDDYDESVLNITDAGGGENDGYRITWGGISIPSGGSVTYNISGIVNPGVSGVIYNNVTANVTCAENISAFCSINTTVICLGPLLCDCKASSNTTDVCGSINWTGWVWGGEGPYDWSWRVDGIETSFNNTGNSTSFNWTFNATGVYEVCFNVTDSQGNKAGPCCTNVTVLGPLLTIEKIDSPDPVSCNGALNYSIRVNNTGTGNATDVTIIDDYDESVLNITDAGGGENDGYRITWGGISIPSGGSVTYNISGIVNPGVSGVIYNNVTANVTCAENISAFSSINTTIICPVPLLLVLVPETDTNSVGTLHYLTARLYQGGSVMPGVNVTWTISGVGSFSGTPEGVTDAGGEARAVITSGTSGTSVVRCEVTGNTSVYDEATKEWTVPPAVVPAGGGGCPTTRYLTVDWDGYIVQGALYSNGRLVQDLLGLSPDGKHSLSLVRGTSAPIIGRERYYVITIRELDPEDIPPLPENTVAIVAVSVTPTGAVFDRDVILTLSFSRLPENALEQTVRLAFYDDANKVWVPVQSTQGRRDGMTTISAVLRHFTVFAVLVEVVPPPPPEPARFVASGLSIQPSVEKIWGRVTFVTKVGESVAISANIANNGGQEGTYTAVLKLNGKTVDSKTVTLGAGQSQRVSFTQSGLDYGRHEVELAGLRGEFTASRTITWWLIVLIVVVLGLIIWGAFWWMRRRRKGQERKSKGRAAPAA